MRLNQALPDALITFAARKNYCGVLLIDHFWIPVSRHWRHQMACPAPAILHSFNRLGSK